MACPPIYMFEVNMSDVDMELVCPPPCVTPHAASWHRIPAFMPIRLKVSEGGVVRSLLT